MTDAPDRRHYGDMTASDEQLDDPDLDPVTRRRVLDLARANTARRGYDLDEAAGWDPADGWGYRTGFLPAAGATVDARLPLAELRVPAAEVRTARASVTYGEDGVTVAVEADTGEEPIRSAASVRLDVDQARALAAAIASAAEELAGRPTAGHPGDATDADGEGRA